MLRFLFEPGMSSHYETALEKIRCGEWTSALEYLERAVAQDPSNVAVRGAKGTVLFNLGRLGEAERVLRKALHLDKGNVQVRGDLAFVLEHLGRPAEALEQYDRVLEIAPDHMQARVNRGGVLMSLGRHAEALANNHSVAAAYPERPLAHFNLGEALLAVGEWGAALAAFDEALRLQPDYAKAHFNCGVALSMVAEFAGAKEAFAVARRLDEPLYRQCLENVRRASGLDRLLLDAVPQRIYLSGMYVRQEACDWRNRTAYRENFLRWLENGEPFMDDQALAFQGLSLLREPRHQLELCRRIAGKIVREAGLPLPPPSPFPGKKEKIRVGYVSPDFRFHPTARLSRQLFHLHDRERFEVYAYSLQPDDGSALHRDIRHACDRFVDVAGLGSRELAQRIREDGIDILVDMAGHTRKSRFEVFALRAAPLQVAYLAFPSTTGADFIDYLVTDAVTSPAGSARFYSERLVFLPRSYVMYDNEQRVGAAPSRREAGLPENGTVFCCFNNPYKVEPEIYSVWMRILERVPGSILWLLAGKEGVESNLRREAEVRGVAPERLVFAPFVGDSPRHLARYRLADLFLDTTVCNAHTTAADALWAGLPVLTCAGEAHWSRVAASLLESVGLPELVAANLMEYENRAVALARRPQDMAELKSKLEHHKRTWPLFDTAALVTSLEEAYQRMWGRHLAGQPPRSFSLPAAASKGG